MNFIKDDSKISSNLCHYSDIIPNISGDPIFLPYLVGFRSSDLNKMEIIYWTCGGVDNIVSLLNIKR